MAVHLEGRVVRFAAAATESQVDLVASRCQPVVDGQAPLWCFEVLGDSQGSCLRIAKNGKANTCGRKGGPLTRFDLQAFTGDFTGGSAAVAVKSQKAGLYLDLDPTSGEFRSSSKVTPLQLVLGPSAADAGEDKPEATEGGGEEDDSRWLTAEQSQWLEAAETSSKACLWQCCCGKPISGDGSLTLSSTKAFWYSLAGALFTSLGSNVFWVGAWTMIDIDLWAGSHFRDSMYTLVGLLLCLFTNTLAVQYYDTPRKKLAREMAARVLAATAARRAEDLKLMAEGSQAGSAKQLAAAKAKEVAVVKARQAEKATTWWSRRLGLLKGDPKSDKKAIRRFERFFEPLRTLVALSGSVLMWVGATNLLSIPEGWLQGFVPTDWWRSQVMFDVALSLLSLTLMNVSCTLGQRTGSEPSMIMEKCGLYAWITVFVDTTSALLLWMGMCDLMGTQLATSDEIGYADGADTVWCQLFYITLGFLCQISTELVASEANSDAGTSDPWNLPSTYDILSMTGGIFLNNGVWTLIDTNIWEEWEYCSDDGSGGGEDGWPTCAVRNRIFTAVGFVILLMQRQVMAEACVYSSPLMTLAVKSVRKENRQVLKKALHEEKREEIAANGKVVLDAGRLAQHGFQLPRDQDDFEATFAEAVADLLNVSLERVRLSADPQEPLTFRISVLPPALGTFRILNNFSASKVTPLSEMKHIALQLTSAFAADSVPEGLEVLKVAERGASFSLPAAAKGGGKGKGKDKGQGKRKAGGGTGARGGGSGRGGRGKGGNTDLEAPLLPEM